MKALSVPFVPGAIWTAHMVANFSVPPLAMESLNTLMAARPALSTSYGMFILSAALLQVEVLLAVEEVVVEELKIQLRPSD